MPSCYTSSQPPAAKPEDILFAVDAITKTVSPYILPLVAVAPIKLVNVAAVANDGVIVTI